jgi:hypothetical protein
VGCLLSGLGKFLWILTLAAFTIDVLVKGTHIRRLFVLFEQCYLKSEANVQGHGVLLGFFVGLCQDCIFPFSIL